MNSGPLEKNPDSPWQSGPPGGLNTFRPLGLGPAGSALWADLTAEGDPFSTLALITEACRITDRLARLDELLRGDADVWSTLIERSSGDYYELRIDSAMAEARQQASVLRQLLAEVRRRKGDAPPGDDDDGLADL